MGRIHFLSAGTPTPTPYRFGSSLVVQVAGDYVMFDCGPATTYKLVKAGLHPTQVAYLFFTHHHFDHDVDLPCFLLCRWDQGAGNEPELQVFGPSPTVAITERLLGEEGAFSFDWKARVGHPTSQRVYVNRGGRLPRRPPFVRVRDVGPGVVHKTTGWSVTAARAEHVQPFLDSLAFRLDSPEGSVVITGDTEPCASVTRLARGAGTLICMCWDDQQTMEARGESRAQCGTAGAAQMARDAGVHRLVLTHIGPHLSQPEVLQRSLADIKEIFDGEIVAAHELTSIPLASARTRERPGADERDHDA